MLICGQLFLTYMKTDIKRVWKSLPETWLHEKPRLISFNSYHFLE